MIDINELFNEITLYVVEDDNFTDDFKKFAHESMVICKLCNIFEEGTGKEIKTSNMNDVGGIISFIKSIDPVIKNMGIDINISDKSLNKIIDFYLLSRKEFDKSCNQ